MVRQFLRRHFVRIVIGAVLMATVYGMLTVWMPYQREQRIAREIESLGGKVEFKYCGPNWISQSIRDRTLFFERIWSIDLRGRTLSSNLHSELGSLTNLEFLNLNYTQVTDAGLERVKGLNKLTSVGLVSTQVTDAGLEHLNGLTRLETLGLLDTQVTDAGLEHLKGLTSLRVLWLHNTQVTAEGRAMLRSAVPGCNIGP